ncbi:hypothetical protein G9F31_00930 [Acinetobacter sp. 187]|uniref:hypothetical protein n=1 Tax=Acinetobacter lanii TaxID=2715163 RepID=UPI001407969C|nr:hypothetical protein [Acinetobacter lanii]NHC02348.1 hypothetical protein [Acinetobacter lanii]
MIDFEKWFADQDFYTNMRFIHGDALFAKDCDVYRVLPVQMTYVAWSEKHVEYAELRQVSVALNTETINQRRYIVSKQSEITQLKAQLIDQGQRFNDQSQKVRDLEFKCEELEKRIKNGLSNVFNCRVIGADRIHTCNVVEEALRGGHETKQSD